MADIIEDVGTEVDYESSPRVWRRFLSLVIELGPVATVITGAGLGLFGEFAANDPEMVRSGMILFVAGLLWISCRPDQKTL